MERPERDVMARPPRRSSSESLLGGRMLWHIGWVGLLIGRLSLGLGPWGWQTDNPAWQSMVFTTLALLQIAHVLAIRVERRFGSRSSIFHQPRTSGACSCL